MPIRESMSEFLRLSLVAAALGTAMTCGHVAWTVNPLGLRESATAQRMFGFAALPVLGCLPLLALVATGQSGYGVGLVILLLLSLTLVLASNGRRRTTEAHQTGRSHWAPMKAGAVKLVEVPPRGLRRGTTVDAHGAVALRIPLLLVAVSDDGHRVELNQN
jgi:hypothetical protein